MAVTIMGILNLSPDSFWEPGRVCRELFLREDIDCVDIGAVSTRPGAAPVSVEEEWSRLKPCLEALPQDNPFGKPISIDTTSSEIVRRAYDTIGEFTVNDISSGEADERMLGLVGRLGLGYIAMHKRGTPADMDTLCDYSQYPDGVVGAVSEYFDKFAVKAAGAGIRDWVLDPGFGFAKTPEQNIALLKAIPEFKEKGHPVLVGVADKRFTRSPEAAAFLKEWPQFAGCDTPSHALENVAVFLGADILRVHVI